MRSDRLLWFILGILGLTVILLMVNDDAGTTFGLENDSFARLIYLGAIALVVGLAFVSRARAGGNMLLQIAVWLAITLGLVAGYKIYQGEPLFSTPPQIPPSSAPSITASIGVTGHAA